MEFMIEKLYLNCFSELTIWKWLCDICGLRTNLDYLRDFRFSESDLAYLQEELDYKEDFIGLLKEFRFTGDVYSMVEGELVFANEPIIRVEAPLSGSATC